MLSEQTSYQALLCPSGTGSACTPGQGSPGSWHHSFAASVNISSAVPGTSTVPRASYPGLLGSLNTVFPKEIEVLTPSTCECDHLCKRSDYDDAVRLVAIS